MGTSAGLQQVDSTSNRVSWSARSAFRICDL